MLWRQFLWMGYRSHGLLWGFSMFQRLLKVPQNKPIFTSLEPGHICTFSSCFLSTNLVSKCIVYGKHKIVFVMEKNVNCSQALRVVYKYFLSYRYNQRNIIGIRVISLLIALKRLAISCHYIKDDRIFPMSNHNP